MFRKINEMCYKRYNKEPYERGKQIGLVHLEIELSTEVNN